MAAATRRTLVHVVDLPFRGWVDPGKRLQTTDPGPLRAWRDSPEPARAAEAAVVDADGSIANTLLLQAQLRLADLTAIGTSARSNLQRALFGSVAQEVIERAKGDTLVVKAPVEG